MFQRKPRRFRRHSNNRNHISRGDGGSKNRVRPNIYLNSQPRNKFRNQLSAEKLLEKYNSLAKEALSSGDKTLAENYLQHADHFMRTIEDKNKNRIQNSSNVVDKPANNENNNMTGNGNINQETEVKK